MRREFTDHTELNAFESSGKHKLFFLFARTLKQTWFMRWKTHN